MNRAWTKYCLELAETDGGLFIRQADEAYLARDWRLTKSVLEVVEIALSRGLACMIQNRHPQPSKRAPMGDGAIYLSFARRSTEYWVLGLNDNAGPDRRSRSDVRRVLFNKLYRSALVQADVPFQLEKFRNASNLEVPVEHVEAAIDACLPYLDSHALQRGKGGLRGSYVGFRDEADIERWLMENMNDELLGRRVSIVARQKRIDVGIIDILLRDEATGGLIVMEVKQGRAQPVHVVEQLTRYLASQDTKSFASGRPIFGCLVAEVIEQNTRAAIENSPVPVVGFTITWKSKDKVLLRRAAGDWPS